MHEAKKAWKNAVGKLVYALCVGGGRMGSVRDALRNGHGSFWETSLPTSSCSGLASYHRAGGSFHSPIARRFSWLFLGHGCHGRSIDGVNGNAAMFLAAFALGHFLYQEKIIHRRFKPAAARCDSSGRLLIHACMRARTWDLISFERRHFNPHRVFWVSVAM
jgi:hypothetical protein